MACSSISIKLTDIERNVLYSGLLEWSGPARLSEEMAVAIGFSGRDDFFKQSKRLREAVWNAEPLSSDDWRRTLLATEIVFASNVVGSGIDWELTTGLSDAETIGLLRGLQHKILMSVGYRHGRQGRDYRKRFSAHEDVGDTTS